MEPPRRQVSQPSSARNPYRLDRSRCRLWSQGKNPPPLEEAEGSLSRNGQSRCAGTAIGLNSRSLCASCRRRSASAVRRATCRRAVRIQAHIVAVARPTHRTVTYNGTPVAMNANVTAHEAAVIVIPVGSLLAGPRSLPATKSVDWVISESSWYRNSRYPGLWAAGPAARPDEHQHTTIARGPWTRCANR